MSNLKEDVLSKLDQYESFTINKTQVEVLSFFHFPSSFEGAYQWLQERDKRLEEERDYNLENHGHYGSFYNVCRSYADDEVCLYETTSGTVIAVTVDDEYEVLLPLPRLGGNSHKEIWLSLGGTEESYRKAYPKPEYDTLYLEEEGMRFHGILSNKIGTIVNLKSREFLANEEPTNKSFILIRFNQPNPMTGEIIGYGINS